MNEEPIRGWRRVADAELRACFGARRLAVGKTIAADGRVSGMARTEAGEVFASIADTVSGTTLFAGVTLFDATPRGGIGTICSCERSGCEHAAAVAVALRAAMVARTPPPPAQRRDARFADLR